MCVFVERERQKAVLPTIDESCLSEKGSYRVHAREKGEYVYYILKELLSEAELRNDRRENREKVSGTPGKYRRNLTDLIP